MPLCLYLSHEPVTPAFGRLWPFHTFDSLDAFNEFKASLPLYDNLAWLLTDDGSGEPKAMSPGLQLILGAWREIHGQDLLAVRAQAMGICREISAQPPVSCPAGKGEHRLSFSATLPKAISLAEAPWPIVNVTLRRFDADGELIPLSSRTAAMEDTLNNLCPPKGARRSVTIAYELKEECWRGAARSFKAAFGKKLHEELYLLAREKVEPLAGAGLAKRELPVTAALADHPMAGHLLRLLLQGTQFGHRDANLQTTAIGSLLQITPAERFLTCESVSSCMDRFISPCIATPGGKAALAKRLGEQGLANRAQLVAALVERYNAGGLPYAPGVATDCDSWRLEIKGGATLHLPSEPRDLAAAMASISAPLYILTGGDTEVRSPALIAEEAELAKEIGSREWFAARYRELGLHAEELPFGDRMTLRLRYLRVHDRTPVLAFHIAGQGMRIHEPFPLEKEDSGGRDLYSALQYHGVGLALYRSWTENHPEGEPSFLEDAIRRRLEPLEEAKERIATTALESYRPEIERFIASRNAGDDAAITLPDGLYDIVGERRLFDGLEPARALRCSEIHRSGATVTITSRQAAKA